MAASDGGLGRFDLADEIAKAHGQESPGVEHERQEIARVRAAPAA